MNIRREQSDHAPSACPDCGDAAYIGMSEVECTNWKCRHFHQGTWEAHVMSLPDTGDPDIEDDEPTHPGVFSFSTGSALRAALDELEKAIDTVPSGCYNVLNGPELKG